MTATPLESAENAPASTPKAAAADRGASSPSPLRQAKAEAPTPKTETPALPAGVVPGDMEKVVVEGDKPVFVIHGAASNDEVLVYLHGACGDATAPKAWSEAASKHGTLVALLGDRKCPGRPGRFYWTLKVGSLQQRVQRALETVEARRGQELDGARMTLVGYSQGGIVAQHLAKLHPSRYPRVVIGSSPKTTEHHLLKRAEAVATFAGAWEPTFLMEGGVKELQFQRMKARFWVLPRASHGEFGPDGERVLGEILGWLYRAAP